MTSRQWWSSYKSDTTQSNPLIDISVTRWARQLEWSFKKPMEAHSKQMFTDLGPKVGRLEINLWN